MRNRRNIRIVPGASNREKKASAFKTISFLESFPENEQGANFSDHLIGDQGDHVQLPRPRENR
jgi:hypothetical protein